MSEKSELLFSKLMVFSHQWGTPLLYALLWAIGLLVAQKADVIFGISDSQIVSVVQFVSVFVIFFCEIIVLFLDLYVTHEVHLLAPRFLLFASLFLVVLIATAISLGLSGISYLEGTFTLEETLGYLILFSTALKFLECLLANGMGKWFVVKIPGIYDAGGDVVRRNL